jgi:threonyl-tRNA synthetase
LEQYNYILVVGEAERAARTVNVRTRDNVVHGMHQVRARLVWDDHQVRARIV